jgi:hypothetical protein
MPYTTIRVLRIDDVHRNGPMGPFRAWCITGSTGAEWDFGTFQAQTTSPLAASVCERAMKTDQQLSVLWEDGRYGREIVNLDFVSVVA